MVLEKFSFKGKLDSKNKLTQKEIDMDHIPKHVAIIMDGNGRWAKKRGLPRMAGHHEGMKTVREIVKVASKLGIKALTLYAFSTENWKRPKKEVDFLMKLPEEFLGSFLPELIEEDVKVQIIGNKEQLPPFTIQAIEKAVRDTNNNKGLTLNFALNYGSRDEVLQATTKIIQDVQEGVVNIGDIDEELFSSYLMTGGLPDPDLLIRTSGEIRLSNFMLWQIAYAEFIFTDVLWPDFKERDFTEAIFEYQRRGRRFGGI